MQSLSVIQSLNGQNTLSTKSHIEKFDCEGALSASHTLSVGLPPYSLRAAVALSANVA